jgi:hypothetical protein
VPGRADLKKRLGLIWSLVRFLGQAPKVCSSRQKESTDDSPFAALATWQESGPALAVVAADPATRSVRGHPRG